MPDLLVALLAAGASRRLRQPKQLVLIQGEPLLRRQCRTALEAQIGQVVVVLGYEAELMSETIEDLPVRICRNPDWREGLASSVRAAVTGAIEAKARGVLFLQADQHRITAADLRALYAAWLEGHGRKACRARWEDYQGPPVILPEAHFAAALGLTGEEGARRLLAALGPDALTDVDMPNAAVDLDTPEHLQAVAATQRTAR